jgi:hypothetical protein
MKSTSLLNSLRFKLNAIVLFILVLVFALMYFFITARVNRISFEDKKTELERRVDDLANIVDERIIAEMDRAKALASDRFIIENYKKKKYDAITKYVRLFMEANDTIENIFMTDLTGNFVVSAQSIEGISFDQTETVGGDIQKTITQDSNEQKTDSASSTGGTATSGGGTTSGGSAAASGDAGAQTSQKLR